MEHQQTAKGQLDSPFLISNVGLDGKVRYLTIAKHHLLQNSFSVEFEDPRTGYGKKDQLWYVERTEKALYFRIRHDESFNILKKNLYVTLVKGKEQHQNQYSIELTHLHKEEGSENQLWTFDLGKNYTYAVKIPVSSEKFVYILPSEDKEKTTVKCGEIIDDYQEENEDEDYIDREDKSVRIQQLAFTSLQEDVAMYQQQSQTQTAFIQIQHEIVKKLKEVYAYLIHFKGKIFPKGSTGYECKIQQYATSSYPMNQMSPYLIAYPVDREDIAIILRHAREQKKNVVARSGGHQYSGLSSGGDDTIVLSMDSFNSVTKNAQGLIEIGPCVPLKIASKHLQQYTVSIPHGECPYVNIGGHAQTGGFGHIIHSFGLCLDYVQAFDIVLADGKCMHVVRPEPTFIPQNEEDQLRIELFRGVLGGNAGSFGIVTKYYFNSIKDSDHPKSYGFSKTRFFDRDLLYRTMQVIKQWTQIIASDKVGGLKGLDIELTVSQITIDQLNIKMPVLLLEGVYSDPDGYVAYSGQFKKILQVFLSGQSLLERTLNRFKGFSNYYPLSQLCGMFVRKPPAVTNTGRQFDHPYKKRTNATMTPLNDQFLTQFSDQVAYVASSKNKFIFVVVQMLFGGGGYYQKGQIKVNNDLTVTSIPSRDEIYFFVYDLFYDTSKNPNAEQEAIELQDKMQVTVNNHFNSMNVGEKRFFWACFGDFDMRKKEVILMYYDSIKQYKQLQKLKDKVDKDNLFNTLMTVKPTSIPIQPNDE